MLQNISPISVFFEKWYAKDLPQSVFLVREEQVRRKRDDRVKQRAKTMHDPRRMHGAMGGT